MSEHQTSMGGAGLARTYQNRQAIFYVGEVNVIILCSVENVRFMMGYIVDLTVILYGLFVSTRDVSARTVHEAMSHHVKSGLRKQIHQDIRRFVTMDNLSTYRGIDLFVEKIIDLIRQSCVPQ